MLEVELATADAPAVELRTPKSLLAHQCCAPPSARKISTSSGSVSPRTTARPASMMPAFSSAIARRQSPCAVGVVAPDVGDHGDVGLDDVGGVVAAEQPDLDDRHVDGLVGEPRERRRGEQVEVAGPIGEQRLDRRDLGDDLGEVVVADRLAVAADALGDRLEVGAGVGADGEAVGPEQGGDHPGGGALAVGPGDVDDRCGGLRVAEHLHEPAHALERQPVDDAGRGSADGGLEVDVRVEVGDAWEKSTGRC